MEWYNIVSLLVGSLGGIGGIMGIYTARAKKNSMEIDNFKKLFDETQETYKEAVERWNVERETLEKKISTLEIDLRNQKRINAKKMNALTSALRCKLYNTEDECPVLSTLSNECQDGCNDDVCMIASGHKPK